MKYLVTGAAGFIGSNLVKHLLDTDHQVVGLDNLSTGFSKNLDFTNSHKNSDKFLFIEGDIEDLSDCKSAVENVDYVLHQAALGSVPRSLENPLIYESNNIKGTLNMLIAARDAKVKRFVLASSSSVYGDTPVLPKVETMTPKPLSPYAISKLTGEHLCHVFYRAYGLPTIALRYFNVFGPQQDPNSQYAAVIPKFITASIANEPFTIHGDGEQTRDFTFIRNVINANLSACVSDENSLGKFYNIGCSSNISINELAKLIIKLNSSKSEINYTPPRPGDVKDSFADINLAKELLKLQSFISLEDGLTETIKWYKENYELTKNTT